MQAATLEALEQADVPPVQVRALARAFEIEISAMGAQFATKADLERAVQILRSEMAAMKAELKAELIRWMFTVTLGQTAVIFGGVYYMIQQIR